MKKYILLVCSALFCIALAACSKTVTLHLPFEASDVQSVELFHFVAPMDAEKKVITQQEDLADLYALFQDLSLKEKKTEPVAGNSSTAFRFYLADGSTYEILYSSIAVKSGRIAVSNQKEDFFTSADIEASWSSCDVGAVPAQESELPLLQ